MSRTLPLAALALLLFAGCIPEEPAWLPDGGGFVYARAEKDGTQAGVFVFDLESGEQTRLATRPGAPNSPLAVSPDGKRVAWVRFEPDGDGFERLRVEVCDRMGRLVHESPWERWRETAPAGGIQIPVPVSAAVWWAPEGERLAILAAPPGDYDLETGEFHRHEKLRPSVLFVLARTPPVLPDGSGYLLEQQKEQADAPRFVVADWQGGSRELTWDEDDLAELKRRTEGGQAPQELPFPLSGRWEMEQALLPLLEGYVVLDPEGGAVSFEPDAAIARAWEAAVRSGARSVELLDGGRGIVQVRETGKDATGQALFTVERVWFDPPSTAPLLEGVRSGHASGDGPPLFHVSPEGTRICLKYRRAGEEARRLLVLDRQGEKLHDWPFDPAPEAP